MRKALFGSFFVLCCLTAQAQHEYTIDGTVKGLKDGTIISLFLSDGRVGSLVANDTVKNESFHFKQKVGESGMDKLSIMGRSAEFPSMSLDLYATPNAQIKITGSDNLIYTWKVDSPVKEQKEQNLFIESSIDLWNEFQRILMQRGTEKDPEKRKILQIKQDSVMAAINKQEMKLMQKLPISTIWMDKLLGLSMSLKYNPKFTYKEETIALYNKLNEQQKGSVTGQEITVYLFPPVIVKEGDDMADTDLFDLEGKTHHLTDYKGKYILLDFWSSGCGPCIMALPEMKELQEQYKDKLTIVSISSDTKSRWEKASAQHGMTWVNLSDLKQNAGLFAKYGVNGIPNYVLISPEGKIMRMWSGYGKGSLKIKMRRYIDEPKKPMVITRKDNVKTVQFPEIKSSNTDIIEIRQVELTDTATVVRIKAYYIPNFWIKINASTKLIGENGSVYALKKAEGVTLDKEFYMPESGEAEFTLIFEPLPFNIQTFDYSEGNNDGDCQINGVRVSK